MDRKGWIGTGAGDDSGMRRNRLHGPASAAIVARRDTHTNRRRVVAGSTAVFEDPFIVAIWPNVPFAWWDPTTGVMEAAGAVTAWTDRVLGETLTFAGPATTRVPAWSNGLPAMDFNAGGYCAKTGSAVGTLLRTAGTVYVVAERTTLIAGAGLDVMWSVGTLPVSSSISLVGALSSNGTTVVVRTEYNGANTNGTTNYGTAKHQYTYTSTATLLSPWVDGVADATRVKAAQPTLDSFAISGRVYLGGVTFPLKGRIADVIVFDIVHSALQRQTVESALRTRWGLP